VDDRSNDNTYDFLLEETKVDVRIKMVRTGKTPERMNAKKYAITLGVKAAKNDLILLTDSDCRPASNNWIQKMTSPITPGKQFVLGHSPYLKEKGLLNLFIQYESFLTSFQYLGWGLLGKPYMGVGRNLCYRKSLFLDNKGFNGYLDITGGDDDLFVNQHANGNNSRICIAPDATVFSIPKKTWRGFLHQKLRHLMAGKHYKATDKLRLAIFSCTQTFSWILGIALLFFPPITYYVLGAFALRFIVLMIATNVVSNQLGNKLESLPIIFLDFLFTIYYLSTGLVALLTKKVKWTN
jgi:cellulose synthase/poly-beta-1,6-N-acetylglucosamine synthase-like glycosyltransferase